jgi:hypothetical protein
VSPGSPRPCAARRADPDAGLRPGLDAAAAADEVWVLNDATLYHALVHQRGWSRERYRTWLGRALRERLLGEGSPQTDSGP